MANHLQPQITSLYTNVISDFNGRLNDIAVGFDPSIATNATNIPTGAVGWQNSASAWYKWSGTAWVALATTYGISISGSAATAAKITTTNWTIEQSGTDIVFKYGGVTKLKLTSDGAITAVSNITAYGTV